MATNRNYQRRENPFLKLSSQTAVSVFDTTDVLQAVEFEYGFQIYYRNQLDGSRDPKGIFSRDFILFLMTAFPEEFDVTEYIYYLTNN